MPPDRSRATWTGHSVCSLHAKPRRLAAADVLVYIGDLELAFVSTAIALESDGMLALSLET